MERSQRQSPPPPSPSSSSSSVSADTVLVPPGKRRRAATAKAGAEPNKRIRKDPAAAAAGKRSSVYRGVTRYASIACMPSIPFPSISTALIPAAGGPRLPRPDPIRPTHPQPDSSPPPRILHCRKVRFFSHSPPTELRPIPSPLHSRPAGRSCASPHNSDRLAARNLPSAACHIRRRRRPARSTAPRSNVPRQAPLLPVSSAQPMPPLSSLLLLHFPRIAFRKKKRQVVF
jgi:hypothetical protein